MRISETWLREWVNPSISTDVLCDALTMAGLEIDAMEPAAKAFSKVVVGKVIGIAKHPEADRLHTCSVDIGSKKPLQIVCGASNVVNDMIVPVALIGAELPNDFHVKPATIRGVASEGMLCSASELGLAEESEGLMVLPVDAPIGKDVRELLLLDDTIIDIAITPNRGDCLSTHGIAREVSALTQAKITPVEITSLAATLKDELPVTITHNTGCPRYVGRIIKDVDATKPSPMWLKERLRRGGIRSINIIVDIMNYVMLELGQPMHAFDLNKIDHEIIVRTSTQGEKILLLDESEVELNEETMIIADSNQPIAIAGVMGGLDSAVTLKTNTVFLESAYFSPTIIAKQRQHYQLQSDSAYRFERGVDSTIQQDAIERASQLILELAGGDAGPVTHIQEEATLPKPRKVELQHEKINKLLGINIDTGTVSDIFKALAFEYKNKNKVWHVNVPSYRFDIEIAEDLIEEVARIHGYDNIPTKQMVAAINVEPTIKEQDDLSILRNAFALSGYNEIISYSFVDKKQQLLLDPQNEPYELLNPISTEMAVMRTNLWPGLISTLHYNKNRQQHRIRLFEIGTCFLQKPSGLKQEPFIGGVISGDALPEQWGEKSRSVDFYDLKGDLENILLMIRKDNDWVIENDDHPALHPGQCAAFYVNEEKIGVMGALHPSIMKTLDLTGKVFIFEFNLNMLNNYTKAPFEEVSKYPEIRRDLALIVNDTVPAEAISDTIRVSAGDWLKDTFIFDVYQGKGISPGKKSIALALIIQHASRTLIDEEVTALVDRVVQALKEQLGAELRS